MLQRRHFEEVNQLRFIYQLSIDEFVTIRTFPKAFFYYDSLLTQFPRHYSVLSNSHQEALQPDWKVRFSKGWWRGNWRLWCKSRQTRKWETCKYISLDHNFSRENPRDRVFTVLGIVLNRLNNLRNLGASLHTACWQCWVIVLWLMTVSLALGKVLGWWGW